MERGFDSGCVDPRVRHSLPHLRGQGACSKFLVSMLLLLLLCGVLFFIVVGVAVVWGGLVDKPWASRESSRWHKSESIEHANHTPLVSEIDMTAMKVAFPNWFLVGNDDAKIAWNVDAVVPDLLVAVSELYRAVGVNRSEPLRAPTPH
jgi:hypothetical protein